MGFSVYGVYKVKGFRDVPVGFMGSGDLGGCECCRNLTN